MSLRSTVPESLDSFVGREEELGELKEAMRASRLVTVVGPGGVGKTRLAFELTRRTVGGRRAKIRLVELATVVDGTRILEAIGTALGVHERGGEAMLRPIVDAIIAQRPTLVIDNCEQVAAACAAVVQELLLECPDLRVLATSRQPLRLAGEHVMRLEPLSVGGPAEAPTREQLLASSAVQLFLDRAKAAGGGIRLEDADIAAVGQLCHRLDGMPLAIELAARRVHSMSVGEVVRCMDDQLALLSESTRTAPERHRDLRAAIEWSYRLLSSDEQRVLRMLSLFPGGLTLAAARAVCAVPDIAVVLPNLVTKSLVRRAGKRFRLLESIRLFGLERLRQAGEQQATTVRAAAWLAELVAQLPEATVLPPAAFDDERDNLSLVYRLLEDHPDEEDTRVLLAGALLWVWRRRGRRSSAGELVNEVLRRHSSSVNTPIVLVEASWLAMVQCEHERALGYAVDAAARTTDRPRLHLRALEQLGWALYSAGRPVSSEGVRRRTVALCQRTNVRAVARAQGNLAWLLVCEGEVAGARALLQVALPDMRLAVARKASPPEQLGSMLRTAGAVDLRAGDVEAARWWFTEVLDLVGRDTEDHAYALEGLAMVAERQGEHARAARLFAAARDARTRLGLDGAPGWRRWVDESASGFALPDEAGEQGDDPISTLLTSSEQRLLTLLAAGDSNQQVARKMGVSASTVRNHVDAMMGKLRVENRGQLIRWYVERRQLSSARHAM